MPDRLEQLTKLHEADPRDPFCTYGIALEHAKADRHDEAIRWLDQTLTLDPQYCYAYFQKGRLFIERGDETVARDVLNQGIQAAVNAGDEHARNELSELLASLD